MPAPQVIGHRYQLMTEIGAGGMGAVHHALDLLTDEHVALKQVLSPARQVTTGSVASEESFRVAMAKEFKTLATLRHPHIIAVRDYGFDAQQRPYFTMDLLENAQTVLEAGRGHSLDVKLDYLAQMLQALAFLHRRGIIHRDLKPENVLVVDGQVKVLDFGLSVAKPRRAAGTASATDGTEGDVIAGTLGYMAPELLSQSDASEASDMYAVGIIAYQLLTNTHPFDMSDPRRLIQQILTEFPDLSRIDANYALVRVVGTMLEKTPANRYRSAADVLVALKEAAPQDIPLETEATRESFLQSVRLVGRDEQVATLSAALQRARDGRGGAWLISGESGVGKSRLTEEIRIRALVSGMLVLRGQAVEEIGSVYSVWQTVFRWVDLLTERESATLHGLFPGERGTKQDSASAETIQERLLSLLIEAVEQVPEPIMFVFEDLQWAGTESIALLRRLCERLSNLPVFLLATYRDDEAPDLPRQLPTANHMPLKRLPPERIAEISEDMLGEVGARPQVIELLQRETEGNMYFLVEIVRTLAEEAGKLEDIGMITLPQQVFSGGIQRIIQRRISNVPLYARDLLYAAAAYGRQLDLKLLAHIAPDTDTENWLLVCSEAAILDVDDDQWRFAHDKLREAVLDRVPTPARQALHHQLALSMEALYGDSAEHMRALAYHWRMAAHPERELHHTVRAGELSVRSGAYQEAIGLMQRALELAQQSAATDTATELFDYKRLLAKAHLGLGQYSQAEAIYRENLTQAQLTQQEPAIARALADLGLVMVALEQYPQAKDFYAESLGHYRTLGDDDGIISVLNHLGDIEYELGNQTQAKQLYQESLDRARQAGSGWGMAGSTTHPKRPVDTEMLAAYQRDRAALLEILNAARRDGDKALMASTLQKLGMAEQQVQNYKEARRLLTLALESFRVLGDTHNVLASLNLLGALMSQAGNYDEAEGYYRQGLQGAPAQPTPHHFQALLGLAQTMAHTAQHRQALVLAGYLLHAPTVPEEIMDTAENLAFSLEDDLTPDEVTAAWEQGKSTPFTDLLQNVLVLQ